jgi:hypothetical protein
MTMPGFTAGASLGKPSQSYYLAGPYDNVIGAVQPALIPHRQGCFWNCVEDNADDPYVYENCRCICYGHPGRTCFLM